jgi:hypothetical protein
MKENENVNEAAGDEETIVGEDGKMTMEDRKDHEMTMEERKQAGLLVVTQEETRIAVEVCYVMEYGEPNKEDWPSMTTELSQRFGFRSRVIKNVFLLFVMEKYVLLRSRIKGPVVNSRSAVAMLYLLQEQQQH